MVINTTGISDNKAQTREKKVSHINIYDPRDPVQVSGGNLFTLYYNPIFLVPSKYKPYGEYGPAGRRFRKAENIEVDNPQGVFGDFHNSHNRVGDWEYNYWQSTKSKNE